MQTPEEILSNKFSKESVAYWVWRGSIDAINEYNQTLLDEVNRLNGENEKQRKVIRECYNAISNGQKSTDHRGLVYSQDFGESFVKKIHEASTP